MGVLMILYSEIDGLPGVDARLDGGTIYVEGDFEAVDAFLEDGWYELERCGTTPDGTPLAQVVSA